MVKRLRAGDVYSHPAHFFALGFGTGVSRYAPGTVGSLLGIPLYLLIPDDNALIYFGSVLLLFVFGVWCCGASAKLLDVHDHPGIVWDEIVGMLIALYAVPTSWWYLGLGFMLFRLFDILKPWPIGWIDRHLHGGLGIMLDDVIAGIMAWVAIHCLIIWIIPWLVAIIT